MEFPCPSLLLSCPLSQHRHMHLMLTRSAARALLTNWVPVVDKSKLPADVLLEIFDAYRQLHQLQSCYENVWNSRNGWLKLTHVCRSWRRLVHLSPFRLHAHLLFAPRRSLRVTILRRLPPFPILIDFSDASWTVKEVNIALAAIRHQSRVRGITLHIPDRGRAKFLSALSLPFPDLESLDICSEFSHKALILPATFLSGPVPCLRRLTLQGVVPSSLLPLLSSATGLVELSLTFQTGRLSHFDVSLLTNMQRLSRLRRLELNLSYQRYPTCFFPPFPFVTGEVLPLSKLTHLIFTGHIFSLESLVTGLPAPSLQHLTAELYHESPHFFTGFFHQPPQTFPIPHLCKFIRDAEYHFTIVCLSLSLSSALKFYTGTVSRSVTDQAFNISLPERVSFKQIGKEISGPLSTVEELVITRDVSPGCKEPSIQPDQWRGFFYHLPQLKVVRIPVGMASDLAHSFQQDDLEPALGLLPALQRVGIERCPELRRKVEQDACRALRPLMAARERSGRPIGLEFS